MGVSLAHLPPVLAPPLPPAACGGHSELVAAPSHVAISDRQGTCNS